MPAKKIQKYVPQTALPKKGGEYNYLMKAGATPADVIGWIKEGHNRRRQREGEGAWLAYDNYVKRWDAGELNSENIISYAGEWRYKKMCIYAFLYSPHYEKLNAQFLAEYDSRGDLQEIYQACIANGRSWVYDRDDSCIDLNRAEYVHMKVRPESYNMYQQVINFGGKSMIEMARETPYVEGDLVLLRDTAIDSDTDPLRISRWSQQYQQGMVTPDKSVKRIGTVMSVTGQLSQSWRPVKGSKVLKIMWMGIEDAKIVDVEERWVKWYERPTYKNGMKTRPE